jgi:hypothetical protein
MMRESLRHVLINVLASLMVSPMHTRFADARSAIHDDDDSVQNSNSWPRRRDVVSLVDGQTDASKESHGADTRTQIRDAVELAIL